MNSSIDMPLDRLVHSIATGPDAVSGLAAMARELGGRRGRRLSELASQIERGKIDPGDQAKRAADFPPRSIGVVQSAEHLPRWIMLEELRDQSSSRLQAVVWFSFAYLLSASAIGLALLQVITPLAPKMDFNWTGRTFEEVPLQPIKIAYEVLVVLLLVSTLIWTMHLVLRSSRQRSGVVARIDYAFDWVVSQIPWIGSARVAVELARISEAIHQSLVSQWTYPAALRAAAVQTDSAMLRAWLTAGAVQLDQGKSFQAVMRTCPVNAKWLQGMSELLSLRPTNTSSTVTQWKNSSNFLHQEMIRRSRRMAVAVAPIATLLSAGIVLLGWTTITRMLFTTIQYIS